MNELLDSHILRRRLYDGSAVREGTSNGNDNVCGLMFPSGYGCSGGKPSERNLYADIAAALAALKSRYQMPAERVILYGQSIGVQVLFEFCSASEKISFVY